MSKTRFMWIAIAATIGAFLGAFFIGVGTAKAQYYPAACQYLDQHPYIAGVEDIVGITTHAGMDPYWAGRALAQTVAEHCPRHWPTLDAYVAKWRR